MSIICDRISRDQCASLRAGERRPIDVVMAARGRPRLAARPADAHERTVAGGHRPHSRHRYQRDRRGAQRAAGHGAEAAALCERRRAGNPPHAPDRAEPVRRHGDGEPAGLAAAEPHLRGDDGLRAHQCQLRHPLGWQRAGAGARGAGGRQLLRRSRCPAADRPSLFRRRLRHRGAGGGAERRTLDRALRPVADRPWQHDRDRWPRPRRRRRHAGARSSYLGSCRAWT